MCTAPSVLLPTQDCDGARPVPRTRVNLVVGPQKQFFFFFTFRWTALQDRSRLAVRDLWPRVLLSLRQGTSPPRASDTLDYNGIWCMHAIHPPPSKSFHSTPVITASTHLLASLLQLTCSSSLQFFFGLLTANPLRLGQTRLALGLPCDTGSSIPAALWSINNCHGITANNMPVCESSCLAVAGQRKPARLSSIHFCPLQTISSSSRYLVASTIVPSNRERSGAPMTRKQRNLSACTSFPSYYSDSSQRRYH